MRRRSNDRHGAIRCGVRLGQAAWPRYHRRPQRLRLGLIGLLLELRRTKWGAINGAGILPEYQGRGGNALLYNEMDKTIREFGFQHADLTQVADTAAQMRSDLVNIGGRLYKTHRVYARTL
jgi:hypothetical protein